MYSNRVKRGIFVLTGVNSLGLVLFFNYLFFFMRDEFGFGNRGNLALGALNGLVYATGSFLAGRLAQRRGAFASLKPGYAIMAITLAIGAFVDHAALHVLLLVVWSAGISMTWPALEYVVSSGEPVGRLPRLLGIYSVTWSAGASVGTLLGGAMMEQLGARGIFVVPALINAAQWLAAVLLERHSAGQPRPPAMTPAEVEERRHRREEKRKAPVPPEVFLKLAWLGNPFGFVAISALLPVIPRIAERFELSPTLAGVFCSVWFFARLGAFILLWLWPGWHYRFSWLIGAMAALVLSYASILLGQELWLLLAAQVTFGGALGLLYFSSLYYSMDVGEDSQGAHGGIHEAAIGLGAFAGPAAGAVSLKLWPAVATAHARAVTVMLLLGLGTMVWIRLRHRTSPGRAEESSGAPGTGP